MPEAQGVLQKIEELAPAEVDLTIAVIEVQVCTIHSRICNTVPHRKNLGRQGKGLSPNTETLYSLNVRSDSTLFEVEVVK